MRRKRNNEGSAEKGTWTFLTNHAHVLICIAQDPSSRVRDLAARVGITERATHRIIAELREAGYLTNDRDGRRNRYTVNGDLPMRHSVEGHCAVLDLLDTVLHPGTRGAPENTLEPRDA
jgi:DNA-binding IclR family transcriptional regulator